MILMRLRLSLSNPYQIWGDPEVQNTSGSVRLNDFNASSTFKIIVSLILHNFAFLKN